MLYKSAGWGSSEEEAEGWAQRVGAWLLLALPVLPSVSVYMSPFEFSYSQSTHSLMHAGTAGVLGNSKDGGSDSASPVPAVCGTPGQACAVGYPGAAVTVPLYKFNRLAVSQSQAEGHACMIRR